MFLLSLPVAAVNYISLKEVTWCHLSSSFSSVSARVLKMSTQPRKGTLLGCCYGKFRHFAHAQIPRGLNSFSFSFISLFRDSSHVAVTVLGTGETRVNRTDKLCFQKASMLAGSIYTINKKVISGNFKTKQADIYLYLLYKIIQVNWVSAALWDNPWFPL